MRRLTQCPFCGAVRHRCLYRDADRHYDVPGTYETYECLECGLLFLNPQPSLEDLRAHYPVTYYSYDSERQFDQRDERLYGTVYGGRASVLRRLLSLPYRHALRTMVGRPGARLLDVGCGSGHFLAMAKRVMGVDTYGVEPYSFDAAFAARNHVNVFHGTLEQAAFPDAFFDCATLSHVLEHVAEPRSLLREVHRVVKARGVVVIAVPQSSSLLYWLFGRYWWAREVPRHLCLPSSTNVKRLVESEGFTVDRVRYYGGAATALGSLMYAYNSICRRHRQVEPDRFPRSALVGGLPFAYLVNLLRIGDMIEIIARRN